MEEKADFCLKKSSKIILKVDLKLFHLKVGYSCPSDPQFRLDDLNQGIVIGSPEVVFTLPNFYNFAIHAVAGCISHIYRDCDTGEKDKFHNLDFGRDCGCGGCDWWDEVKFDGIHLYHMLISFCPPTLLYRPLQFQLGVGISKGALPL